jgi:hypothetical protein
MLEVNIDSETIQETAEAFSKQWMRRAVGRLRTERDETSADRALSVLGYEHTRRAE